ncbi:SHOCT domain-containing protein [Streptomyces exfoliatus]|uniref:SHOCT domain-containing protein n=1 Tax=Streptomyces exfoliatus TaxID=1905 RepID=UPI0004B8BE40|nr:SHOCT domain-containing protein [Streptomyces exfoliatus]
MDVPEYGRAAAVATEGTPTGHADQLSKLADLKNNGDITAAEYERVKEKVLAG